MACPGIGPCLPYTLDLCCLGPSGILPDPCLTDGTPVPQATIDSAVLAASQLAWAVTGRQFGTCEVTIRPCRKKCNDACCIPTGFSFGSGFPWTPVHLADGTWTNVSCDCQGDACSCTSVCSIDLPYPVCSVEEVLIDGEIVDPQLYRVDDFKRLVRLGLDLGLSNTKYVVFQPVPTTVTGGTFALTLLPGVTAAIPWDASEADLQAAIDVVVGVGNSLVVEIIQGQPLTGGFTIELIGTYAETDVPGFIIDVDFTLLTGPDAPYTSQFGVSIVGGQEIIIDSPNACWPECNDLTKLDGAEGTWSVTLTYGRPVPELVRLAAAEFACELIKGCVNRPCKLPRNVVAVTRQGVSEVFTDPTQAILQGLTGLYMMDLAIRAYNPRRLQQRAAVFSVDSSPNWTVGGTEA